MQKMLDKHGSEILAGGFGVGCIGLLSAVGLTLNGHAAASIACAIFGWLGFVAMILVATNDFRPNR